MWKIDMKIDMKNWHIKINMDENELMWIILVKIDMKNWYENWYEGI